jgi:hypothetical protein
VRLDSAFGASVPMAWRDAAPDRSPPRNPTGLSPACPESEAGLCISPPSPYMNCAVAHSDTFGREIGTGHGHDSEKGLL